MSKCISHHGEYSSHEPGDDFRCQLCGVLDEDVLIERVERAEAVIAQIVKARRNHPECDRDETTCGWKRTVQDTDAALATYQNGADQ